MSMPSVRNFTYRGMGDPGEGAEYIGEYEVEEYAGEEVEEFEGEAEEAEEKAVSVSTNYEPEDGQGDCVGYCDSESDNSNWNLGLYNQMLAEERDATCKDPYEGLRDIEFTKDIIAKFFLSSTGENGIAQLQLPGNLLYSKLGRRIGNKDIDAIAGALPQCPNINSINLAYNDIDDDGAAALGSLLEDYTNITRVNLMHNNLTSKGIWKLVSYLVRRRSLFELKLAGMKFGDNRGINSLICLIMSGCCPVDLDISECDLTMEAYQALCTAWESVDHDEDYPKSFLRRKMPLSLRELATIKQERHDNMVEILKVEEMKETLAEMSRIQAERCRNNKCTTSLRDKLKLDDPDNTVDRLFFDYINNQEDESPQDLFTEFSSSLLEGLFTLPPAETEHIELTPAEIQAYDESKNIIATSKQLPDTNLLVEKFRSVRKERVEPTIDKNHKPVFVDSSLYMLDVHEDPEMDFRHVDHTHQVVHDVPLYLDYLLDRSGKETIHDDEEEVFGATDETTAGNAAIKVTADLILASSMLAGTSQWPDNSDITQLMLMVILDSVDKLSKVHGEGNVFTEEMIYNIIEEGVEKVEKILFPRLPTDCTVKLSDIRIFMKTLFVNAQSTFTALMNSPYVAETLLEACSGVTRKKQHQKEVYNEELLLNKPTTLSEEQVRVVCINFLEGAIKEASRIIGVGDPFGYHSKSNTIEDLEPHLDTKENTEKAFTPILDRIFEESSKLAAAAKNTVKALNVEDAVYNRAGQLMVEDVFADVLDAVIDVPDFQNVKKAPRDPLAPEKYPYASRPVRLVLNRPLFAGNEELIAAKLAQYLKKNSSVKILHIRKWGLGEDGTQVLMDGLMHNMNIVTLDLGANKIGPEGASKIAEYVSKSLNLRHLLLNHNQLRNPGIQMITEALVFTNLVTLNVAYNDIDDEGLDPFLKAVSHTGIQALYVLGNRFSESSWHILNDQLIGKRIAPNMIDIVLQKVDENCRIVKNMQSRDINEWYEVPPIVSKGLEIPPYFLENVSQLQTPLPPLGDTKKTCTSAKRKCISKKDKEILQMLKSQSMTSSKTFN